MKRNNVINRLSARPRMNARSSGDGESWNVSVVMFLSDAEKFVGRPMPVAQCKRDYPCYTDSRRKCEACAERFDWNASILRIVTSETEFAFYAYSSGPGRPFAHEPSVYVPRRSRNKRAPVLRITQHGGLDI